MGKYNFDFSGRSILVVEDNLMSYKLMETVFTQVKASVTRACDGEAAIDMCAGDLHFDLVVMDLQMPGMNGIEATREIKKLRPELPVIAATANSFEDEEAACMEAGCVAYLIKPLNFRRLFEFMQELLDS
jgi:CheY-like chemotaxis protein